MGSFKPAALLAYLWPPFKVVWNNTLFLEYVDRWVNIGLWQLPDPCAPVSQGGGPDGKGGCILDPDLVPGSNMTHFSCKAGKQCGRWPDRHGTLRDDSHVSYSSDFFYEMWDEYRNSSFAYDDDDDYSVFTTTGPATTTPTDTISGMWRLIPSLLYLKMLGLLLGVFGQFY
jgi:hypothetical protein